MRILPADLAHTLTRPGPPRTLNCNTVPSRALMSALKEVNFARVVGTRQRNNLLMRLSLKLSRVGRVAEDALFWREAKWLLIVYLIYTPPMVWNSFVAPYYGPYVVSAPLMFALQGESLECYFILLFNRTFHCASSSQLFGSLLPNPPFP